MNETLPEDTNPSSLVFVLYDVDGAEVSRFAPTVEQLTEHEALAKHASESADYQMQNPGSYVVCYDGNSGQRVAAIGLGDLPPVFDIPDAVNMTPGASIVEQLEVAEQLMQGTPLADIEPDWKALECLTGPEYVAEARAWWELRQVEKRAAENGGSFT